VSGEVLVTASGGRLAVLVHRRSAVATLTLLVAVAALAMLSTAVGTRLLPVSDVLAGLTGTAERAVNLTVREFPCRALPSPCLSAWRWACPVH
jgi:ABC-type enterobactin transport system permease subunit